MPLLGQALAGIWHSIQPGGVDEYLAWNTYEHMPERLGVPSGRWLECEGGVISGLFNEP